MAPRFSNLVRWGKPSADLTSGFRTSVLGIWIGLGPGILGFEEVAWTEEEDDASERAISVKTNAKIEKWSSDPAMRNRAVKIIIGLCSICREHQLVCTIFITSFGRMLHLPTTSSRASSGRVSLWSLFSYDM